MNKKAPRLKSSKRAGVLRIGPDYPDEANGHALLMKAIGTTDEDFYRGLITQLAETSSKDGHLDEQKVNFMLSVIKGIEPRDQTEAMIAAQMAAVHLSAMTFTRRLANAESVVQQDSAERIFNKLMRTFAAQMEAFKRYRTGGEQKVTVQHVNVSEGGQAIVGNVTQERLGSAIKSIAAPLALADKKTLATPAIQHAASTKITAKKK